jgi:hypothetical protein
VSLSQYNIVGKGKLYLSVSPRVKLAVCKESGDCVAVKIVTVDGGKEGLTHESLRKEVSSH